MGTSTAWPRPSGGWGAGAAEAAILAVGGKPGRPASDDLPPQTVDDLLDAVYRDLRGDPVTVRLRQDTHDAGDRLAQLIGELARERPDSADGFVVCVTRSVGGDGGTLTAAVIRRAAGKAAQQVLDEHPEAFDASARGGGRGLALDVLCDLFRFFFAEVAAQWLRSVIAAHVEAMTPWMLCVDPDSRFAERLSRKLVNAVVSPCDHLADHAVQGTHALARVAHTLVPAAVRAVLGHEDGDIAVEGGAAR